MKNSPATCQLAALALLPLRVIRGVERVWGGEGGRRGGRKVSEMEKRCIGCLKINNYRKTGYRGYERQGMDFDLAIGSARAPLTV